MARLDERLRRDLVHAGRPADPTGVYEHLIRRRERRRMLRRAQCGVLGLAVVVGSGAAVLVLLRVFEPSGSTPGVDPAPVPIVTHEDGLIAYSRSTSDGMELHSVMPDGTGDTVIPTPPGLPWLHAWSPDGSKIAVAIFPTGGGQRAIWVMNADGSQATQVATAEDVSVPSWSPDGSTIAYSATHEDRTEIHLVAPDGRGDRVIHGEGAEGTFAIFSARFSPDGRRILFDRGTDSGFDIFLMNVDGSDVRRLTTTGTDHDPHWSPDGTQITFTRQGQGARSDIYVMDADGTNVRQLTRGSRGTTNLYAQWSPNGTRIAYVRGVTGGPGSLVVMNADGSDPVTLVDGEVLGISWQPLPAAPPAIEPTPSGPTGASSTAPRDVDVLLPGVGRTCGVTSIEGRFLADAGTTAYVFEPEPKGGCDGPNEEFQFIGIADATGDIALVSDRLRDCSADEGCWVFAAPDVDGDGRDEIAVAARHEDDAVWFSLYRVQECGPGGGCLEDRWLQRFEIAEPGDLAEGFAPGPIVFRWGGPAQDVAGVTCDLLNGRPALVQWYSATYDQWLPIITEGLLDTEPGSELDLTAGMLDEICGAPVAVERPPSLGSG